MGAILRMRAALNIILADASGQTVDRIALDVDRDYLLEPKQALEYGLIDRIIEESRELKSDKRDSEWIRD